MPSSPPELVSLRYAAETLGVSEATVRNWIRAGILAPAESARPMRVQRGDLERLKVELNETATGRLKSRANKSQSRSNRVPRELGSARLLSAVRKLCSSALEKEALRPESLLVTAAVYSARLHAKPRIESYLLERYADAVEPRVIEKVSQRIDTPFEIYELVSLVHQALSDDGEKSAAGSIYTPASLTETTAQRLIARPLTVFDPCVGSGIYLVAAARQLKSLGVLNWAEFLFGVDTDPLAVLATTLNLILEHDVPPSGPLRISQADSLSSELDLLLPADGVDVVMTNPPWGARFSRSQLKELERSFPEISSRESFSFFVAAGLRRLKRTGSLAFLLPESVLTTSLHEDLRRLMLHYGLARVTTLGKAFSGIMTNVIEVELNRSAQRDDLISVYRTERDNMHYALRASSLFSGGEAIIGLDWVGEVQDTLSRIEAADVFYLKDRAQFALGIVTGNNKELLRASPLPGDEPIFTGKEVSPYVLEEPRYHVHFDRSFFQQCAKTELYRSNPKLIYRFISQKLVVSLDTNGVLTLNSANILVPSEDLDPYYLLGVLNARYATYYLQKKFSSLKVLKKHLESLPIPLLPQEAEGSVVEAVKAILRGEPYTDHQALIDSTLEEALGICLSHAQESPGK